MKLKIAVILLMLPIFGNCSLWSGASDETATATKDAAIGADKVRWDLTGFYSGIDDPQLMADVAKMETLAKAFRRTYQGRLKYNLGPALGAFGDLTMLSNKIVGYVTLASSLDHQDDKVQTKLAEIENRLNRVQGEDLTWFDSELARLTKRQVAKAAFYNGRVRRHLPFINNVRSHAPHLLSDEVESELARRSMYGSQSWVEFYDAIEASLRSRMQNENIWENGMGPYFLVLSAQTLNEVAGEKSVDDADRGYAHPMAARNEDNGVSDEMVEALHLAVKDTAGPLARRYYRLKAAILERPMLDWGDQNDEMPFSDARVIPFDEGFRTVVAAYGSFSPTMAKLAQQMRDQNRIDAAKRPAKSEGSFCLSLVLPGGQPVSYVLTTYQGSPGDVMTLAHELGHAVHGLLAGQAQGPLMADPPMAYAETASLFGELTTFYYLRDQLEKKGDKKALLALLTAEIEEVINTDVLQIAFSNFERRVHAAKRRLSVDELDQMWADSAQEMYGKDGEAFKYRGKDHFWAFVPHFHRPFYVYSYAFGDLLTTSLYAQRPKLGDQFEPLYLEMLRSGGTKNAVQLLQPFGLDPRDPEFWKQGIRANLGTLIDQAEKLAKELGYKVK